MRRYVVFGMGRFGTSVACQLMQLGQYVLAVDKDEERIKTVQGFVSRAVVADATDPVAVARLGLSHFNTAVVSLGGEQLEESVLAVTVLKEAGISHVVAKAQGGKHGKILERAGADRVVYPEREMGERVAHFLANRHVREAIELSPRHVIVEITPSPEIVGQTIGEAAFFRRYNLNVLAIKRGNRLETHGLAKIPLQESDVLIVLAEPRHLCHLGE